MFYIITFKKLYLCNWRNDINNKNKTTMKKIFGIVLLAVIFAFTSCGPSRSDREAEQARLDSIAEAEEQARMDSIAAAEAAAAAAAAAAQQQETEAQEEKQQPAGRGEDGRRLRETQIEEQRQDDGRRARGDQVEEERQEDGRRRRGD